jgi:hypothetical protein
LILLAFSLDHKPSTLNIPLHTIRLRGPWQLEPIRRYVEPGRGGDDISKSGLPPAIQCQMPADWCGTMGHDFLGAVRHSRKFNRPTNLERDRVCLVVEPPRSCGLVRVNRQVLGYVRFGSAAGRFDITELLEDHNVVEIDVEHPELDDNGNALDDGCAQVPGGLVGEVRLEIED